MLFALALDPQTSTTVVTIMFGILALMALYFLARKNNKRYNQDREKVQKVRDQLDTEVRLAFTQVATKAPTDEALRDQVILAAQCLILDYSTTNSRRIIGPGDYQSRYNQGLAITAEIRKKLGY